MKVKDRKLEDYGKPCILSTKDNPFNPFTDYDDWRNYDVSPRWIPEVGMKVATYCREYQAREAITSDDLSDEENNRIISDAIDDIIRLDPFHIYIKVIEPSKVNYRNGY
ncbi:MAG: hypothetical protein J6U54_08785 [Clostridiales bacterium]|nr:hypothetical protein [Clostridiales bacterium]